MEECKTNPEGFKEKIGYDVVSKKPCKHLIDSMIYTQASPIPFVVVDQLHELWHIENGKREPESFAELLEATCL